MESKQKKQKADIWHKNAYALEKQIWYSDTVKKWVRCGLTFIFYGGIRDEKVQQKRRKRTFRK